VEEISSAAFLKTKDQINLSPLTKERQIEISDGKRGYKPYLILMGRAFLKTGKKKRAKSENFQRRGENAKKWDTGSNSNHWEFLGGDNIGVSSQLKIVGKR